MQNKRANHKGSIPWVLLCIAVDILSIGLIPLNLFVLYMPERITIVFSFLIIAATVILWAKTIRCKMGKAVLSVINIIAMLFTLLGAYCNPYWNNLLFRNSYCTTSKAYTEVISSQEAMADLDYAMKYLEKCHPELRHGFTDEMRIVYEQTAEKILNSGSVTVNDLTADIESIFSMLSDGHTAAICYPPNDYYLREGYVRYLAGDIIVAVNGISIEDILQQNKALYSYESESYALTVLAYDLTTARGLDYLGMEIGDKIVYTYETVSGERTDFAFYPADFITHSEYVAYNRMNSGNNNTGGAGYDTFVHYSIDEENNLAMLTLNSCIYNDEYIQCVKDMFTEVKNRNIQNVCVDLRWNIGGNSLVANEFIKYLDVDQYGDMGAKWRLGFFEISSSNNVIKNEKYDKLTFSGNVYVLSSYSTYSSAMAFVQYIKDNHLGTIIGEPPGNAPNCGGEVAMFKCPNSGIVFQVSTKYYQRIDKDSTDLLIQPDIICDKAEAVDKLMELLRRRHPCRAMVCLAS